MLFSSIYSKKIGILIDSSQIPDGGRKDGLIKAAKAPEH